MWIKNLMVLALFGAIAAASIIHCPAGAICREQGSIDAKSFTFLNSLDTKQYRDITRLTISNASLDKVPPELKYFKELKYLDLSQNNIQISSIPSLPKLKILKLSENNIKSLSLAMLPKNIEELDLSNNLLSHIPQDYSALRSLTVLNLTKNLFDCDCYNYNVLTYRKLLKDGIRMQEPITCQYPKQFSGKNINSINCTLNDIMVYDEPEEGSGSGDDTFFDKSRVIAPHLQEEDNIDENEFVDDANELPKDEETNIFVNVTDDREEGSGELEGSGFAPIEIPIIPSCHINCSDPEPVGAHDGNDTAPVPGPTDQIKILTEDLFNPTTTSTSTTPKLEVVTEKLHHKEQNIEVFKESDKRQDVEVFLNGTETGEMEKATALNQNNYTVYVVAVCGLILTIVFSICLIKKRKANRIKKNRRDNAAAIGDEMKPLEKTAVTEINEKNGKNIQESTPLINGQNGKHIDEPTMKAYIPLEHPEKSNGNNYDEPEMRDRLAPSTPRERVTIRASELPDSIPKTPVVLHRQKNSEGEIVTTVVPS